MVAKNQCMVTPDRCAMNPYFNSRDYPSVTQFSKGLVGAGNVTVDTDAWQKAIEWAVTQNAYVLLPGLDLRLAEGAPPITNSAAVLGVSPMRSRLLLQPQFTGAALTIRNAGFGGCSQCFPVNGPTAFASSVDDGVAGVSIKNIAIIGDRSLNAPQTGLLIEGNVDHLTVEDVFLGYLNGWALRAGNAWAGMRGQIRESSFSRIRVRNCGRLDSTASISFCHFNESPEHPTADSSNLFTLDDIHVVFPYGRGLEFVESGSCHSESALYGVIGKNIMLHGRHVHDTRNNGALLHLEGKLKNIKLEVNFAFSDKGDMACRIIPNAVTGAYPADITVDAMLGDVWAGVEIRNGENINWIVEQNSFLRREMMVIGDGLHGPVHVRCTGDISFLRLPMDVTLNGSAPVVIPGLHPSMGALAFMSIDNEGGVGDTVRVEIAGLTGTLARQSPSSVLEQGHTYTFTPDCPRHKTLRAGDYFSKFVVGDQHWSKFSGRFRFAPVQRF